MRKIVFAAVMTIVGFDTFGMQSSPAMAQISDWKVYNPISTDAEMEIYRGTWNPAISLDENRSRLVQRFSETCLHFFPSAGQKFNVVTLDCSMILHGPSQNDIDKILGSITKMSENPVGCKLMRLLLTKYSVEGASKKFSELYVGNGQDGDRDEGFLCVENAGQAMFFMSVGNGAPGTNFSMFAGKADIAPAITASGKKRVTAKGLSEFTLFQDNIMSYEDCKKFDIFLMWLHRVSGIKGAPTSDVISRRYSSLKGKLSPEDREEFVSRFRDDSAYRRTFGVVYDGKTGSMMIDPLNECAYLTAGYNFMRLEYCSWETPTLSKKFLESFADKELWSFYLDKLIKLPQFGKGQYQCSDIDPETGLKKD